METTAGTASEVGERMLHLEELPSYAPDLNPTEWAWNQLKHVEMRNLVCLDLEQLHMERHLAIGRLRQKPHLLKSFFVSYWRSQRAPPSKAWRLLCATTPLLFGESVAVTKKAVSKSRSKSWRLDGVVGIRKTQPHSQAQTTFYERGSFTLLFHPVKNRTP